MRKRNKMDENENSERRIVTGGHGAWSEGMYAYQKEEEPFYRRTRR